MRLLSKLAVIAGTTAAGGHPAVAPGAAGGHANNSTTHPTGTKQPPKAKAYGKFCENHSRTRTAGKRGTPFSACVQGARKLLREQSGG